MVWLPQGILSHSLSTAHQPNILYCTESVLFSCNTIPVVVAFLTINMSLFGALTLTHLLPFLPA